MMTGLVVKLIARLRKLNKKNGTESARIQLHIM